MRLTIRHETRYAFDTPLRSVAQLLRLTPSDHAGQTVLSWRVAAGGEDLPGFEDGYGNRCHLLTRRGTVRDLIVTVQGEVETEDRAGLLAGQAEPLPPAFFLRTTDLTAPDEGLRALAVEAKGEAGHLARLHALMGLVRDRVAYRTGTTGTATTAAAALAGGQGVCQDQAHVMIAAARSLGIPARYAGGYYWPGANGRDEPAAHAWMEGHVEGLGWVGFDPANGVCPTDRYVRVAVGLDYADAAPVRGVRQGGGTERLTVSVRVDEMAVQQ
ncbi:MAG TPA: transglutaminase family protein [Azospirillaceae bacterium]|nr:transglutaminase family protein [Azospirillaceae bacterium]